MLKPEAVAEVASETSSGLGKLGIVLAYTAGFFVVLPVLLLQLGARLDEQLGLPQPGRWACLALGLMLTASGGRLLLQAMWTLWQRGKGLPISHLPPTDLVDQGPFARLRHPIYVGYTALLAGLGWLLRSYGGGLVAPLLLTLAWTGYATRVEEPLLRLRFGAAYARYSAQTPLLPMARAVRESCAKLLRVGWRWLKPSTDWLAQRTVLFRFGSSLWVGYGAFLAVGASAACALSQVLLAPQLPLRELVGYVVGLSLAMLLGGRVVWLAYEARALVAQPLATLRRVGFVSFGAYLAMFGFAAAWWHWRAPGVSLGWLMDRTMASCLVCSGFGRLGCLTYGCCYGRVWSDGICYRHSEAKVVRERGPTGHAPRLPTQLFSAWLAFASATLMLALLAAGTAPGFATELTALIYALVRFQLEGLRDEARFVSERLTRGQLLSMAIATLALLALSTPQATPGAENGLRFDTTALSEHWLLPLLAAVPVFLVCGYHRERVGTW
jgi:prolipoprotein diacylglyceryltransferase/protein-S-isoprenylcysteine O-methyltransferase Ste14